MSRDRLSYKIHYRRNLPHIQQPGASLFITFRLAGSLPASAQRVLQSRAKEREQILAIVPDPAERARRRYELQK